MYYQFLRGAGLFFVLFYTNTVLYSASRSTDASLGVPCKSSPLISPVRSDKVCLCEFLQMFVSNFLFRRAGGCLSSNCSMQIRGWCDDAGAAAPRCGTPVPRRRSPHRLQGPQWPAVPPSWRATGTTGALPSTPPSVCLQRSRTRSFPGSCFSLCPLWPRSGPGTAVVGPGLCCPAGPGNHLTCCAEPSGTFRAATCRVEPDQAICMTDCNS